jgi:uncharacterized membrane protein
MNLSSISIPVKAARHFYAAALLAFGIQHFIFGFFIAGRPMPWPFGLPGELIIAYASGILFIVAAVAIVIHKKAVEALMGVAIIILLWAGLRNIIHVVTTLDTGGNLTNMGKALTLGSGALLVARSFEPATTYRMLSLAVLCQYFTGSFLLASGIQHFLYADFVRYLVPEWIPGALFVTYFSGVALCAAGLGLLTGIKARLACILAGWMVLIWFFVLHLPRAIENNNQNEWTAVFEALAVSGILFLLVNTIRERKVHLSR